VQAYINGSGNIFGKDLVLARANRELDYNSANTLLNLQDTTCTGYKALSRNLDGIISCINVTDLYNGNGQHMGQTIMPSCASNHVLTSTDGLAFSCRAAPAGPPGPAGPAGAQGPAGPQRPAGSLPNVSCPGGQVLIGIRLAARAHQSARRQPPRGRQLS
jgi:hypothetical protein